jgi:oxygen-independent coproporphyrinogen-3 oxidase
MCRGSAPISGRWSVTACPTPACGWELFGLAYEQLLAAGYSHVGMDHFALPDDELAAALRERSLARNFMGYTTRRGLDLVGLGASSISFVNTTFAQNEKDVPAYVGRAGQPLWVKGLEQTPEDRLRGEVIMELMCNFYLAVDAVEDKYGIRFAEHFSGELAELELLQADGLVRVTALRSKSATGPLLRPQYLHGFRRVSEAEKRSVALRTVSRRRRE